MTQTVTINLKDITGVASADTAFRIELVDKRRGSTVFGVQDDQLNVSFPVTGATNDSGSATVDLVSNNDILFETYYRFSVADFHDTLNFAVEDEDDFLVNLVRAYNTYDFTPGDSTPGGGLTTAQVNALIEQYADDNDLATVKTLQAFLADDAGTKVANSEVNVRSASDTFWIVLELSDTNPRMGFVLPDDTALVGVFDNGVRIDETDFDESPTGTYTHNFDIGAGWVQYLVRTENT